MTRTVLIDGDILVYKAAFAAEEVHTFDDQVFQSSANLSGAQAHIDRLVENIAERTKADAVIVATTADNNWRKVIYPEYKAQRKAVRRPLLLKPLLAYLADTFKTFTRPTLEADDVLGILATSKILVPGEKVIATIDKDLLQIPGLHYNIDKPDAGIRPVSEAEGDYLHFMQTLTGDIVDNYKGCPGVGKVGAAKILSVGEGDLWRPMSLPQAWLEIVYAFEKKGLTPEHALIQARIARVCRAADYDFTAKAVRLWTPPNMETPAS